MMAYSAIFPLGSPIGAGSSMCKQQWYSVNCVGKCTGVGECTASYNAHVGAWMWLQGVDGWDVDLPTFLEANWITNTVAKTLWVAVYIIVYGIRPVLVKPKTMGAWLCVQPALLFWPPQGLSVHLWKLLPCHILQWWVQLRRHDLCRGFLLCPADKRSSLTECSIGGLAIMLIAVLT